MTSRHAFGSRLRTQRERRGITLESIVDSTKIKQSLLEALERGDASQWPRGLFRRAYLRDYANAIGVPAEPLVAEFVKLFPEDGSIVSEDLIDGVHEPLRLTFAVEGHARARQLVTQALAVVAEIGVVGLAGAVASFATGWPMLTACGAVALVYYPLATGLTGRVLSPAHLRGILKVHPAGAAQTPASASPEPAALYLVPRQQATPSLVVGVAADEFPQARTAAR